MNVAQIETDIRHNIADYITDPKFTLEGEILDSIGHVLNDLWKHKRMAFCESEVLTVKPAFPAYEADEIPVSDYWVDTVINGVSARILRYNSTDPASMRAAVKFETLYQQAIA